MKPTTRRKLVVTGQQAAGRAGDALRRAATPFVRKHGFPYLAPSVPGSVEVPEEPSELGADYDTEWARTPAVTAARSVLSSGPLRIAVDLTTRPTIEGRDRLDQLLAQDPTPPVIFAPNHHSHLDTGLMLRAIPFRLREHLAVAAAADYFFDRRWKAALSAFALNAVPIDREATSRQSSDRLRSLLQDGNSVLIYPEGGRSPDGWGQEFKGGAAYLSIKTGAPVVPVYIEGTGAILGKGAKRLKPGRTKVVFGRPLHRDTDESTRRFAARIEAAVARLGDEAVTDYWSAARRAADGESPSLAGPDLAGWRRQWALTERRKQGIGGMTARKRRRWPNLERR